MDYFLEMYGGICLRGCHKEKVILRYDFGRLVLSTLNGVFLEVALCTCLFPYYYYYYFMFLWIGNGAGSHTPDCPSKCAAIGSLKTAPHGLVKLPNRNRSLVSSNYESLIILRTQRYHDASVEIN